MSNLHNGMHFIHFYTCTFSNEEVPIRRPGNKMPRNKKSVKTKAEQKSLIFKYMQSVNKSSSTDKWTLDQTT